ncbi:hypothetical protein ACFXC8_00420 [Streptomyces sp. NPDC059441]|uniref:hypothetical protein n=1 Tax=Streptomyces sp. NPDC059441 TaxID=3346829 RepID=UPI0036D0E51B
MVTGNKPPVPAEPEPQQPAGRTTGDSQFRGRDGQNRFVRTPAGAARDAKAAQLRADGWTLTAIAEELGYYDRSTARRAILGALREVVRGPAENLVATEAARLDALYEEALEVLLRDHVTVSHGKVIKDDDGNPLIDDGPKLAAIDRLVKVRESYRKLLGLDAPSRVSVDAQQLGDEISALLDRGTAHDDTST